MEDNKIFIAQVIKSCDDIISQGYAILNQGSRYKNAIVLKMSHSIYNMVIRDIDRFTEMMLKSESEDDKDAYVEMLLDLGECLAKIDNFKKDVKKCLY